MLGLKRGTVKLVSAHDEWARLFQKEKQLLLEALGDRIATIEHVGSTAIPGVPAKPIIDIRIAVSSLDDKYIEGFIAPLKKLGYSYMHKFSNRHFFAKGPEENRTHHISLVKTDNKTNGDDSILFRDYMRRNKPAQIKYAALKQKLAGQFAENRALYTKAKEKFIEKMIQLANVENRPHHMNTNKKTKRILCYGDSNTWGWVPASMGTQRYPAKERWPGILQTFLGKDYEVIEEGLGGRTTMFDDPRPEFPERNGLKTLPIILETHLPLDGVIIMLGTTDTKEMLGVSSETTAQGMLKLVRTIKNYRTLKDTATPQIIIVVPPIIKEDTEFAAKLFKGGTAKAKNLIELYKNLADNENILYLDPTSEIFVDESEGIHFDAANHKKLAKLIYEKVKNI